MIRTGQMRHRIRVEQRVSTRDEAGGAADTWAEVVTIWAAIERTPGLELFASAARDSRVPTVFRCRYREDLNPAMRIIYRGKVHDIHSIADPEGRRAEILIVSREQTGETP